MHTNTIDRINSAQLRPQDWGSFIGQGAARSQFDVMIEAARQRGGQLDHLLLSGPPGLGKSTLARLAAGSMGGQLHTATGLALTDLFEFAAVILSLEAGDCLFVDEVHALPRRSQELLYSAMEDYELHLTKGSGENARTITFETERFTLIGATTRAGSLNKPLRERFVHEIHLDFYAQVELAEIIARAEPKLGIALEGEGRALLAKVSRGTPRFALRYLRQIRDYVQLAGDGSRETVRRALDSIGIGPQGETWLEMAVLEVLVNKFEGVPVGLGTLAAAAQQSPDDVAAAECYLMELGYADRTPQGRVATGKGLRYVRERAMADVMEGVAA